MRHKNNKFTITLFILTVLIIGIGYAALSTNLSITGATAVAGNTWDIHFANLQESAGSVTATTPATIDTNDNTAISYAVTLNRPGDFYEFTVDIVNNGTLPGKISIIDVTGLDSSLTDIIEHSITYTANNKEVKVNDLLDPSTSKNIKVRTYFKMDIDEDDLPSTTVPSTITINIDYQQGSELENPINPCTYNGELTQGAEYVSGQYTYRYRQQWNYDSTWINMTEDGWGMRLTDKDSTDPITSKMCTSINDKPIISMAYTFYNSKATSIDLSSFNTSNVTNMQGMFRNSKATPLNVSKFNTSNVENMLSMFESVNLDSLDLSNFDTHNVKDMTAMFCEATINEPLDLTMFDTENLESIYEILIDASIPYVDFRGWDNPKLTDMKWGFMGFDGELYLTGFKTPLVNNMMSLFSRSTVSELDLSSFSSANIVYDNAGGMFSSTPNLTTIYVTSAFELNNYGNGSGESLFINSQSLIGGNGTSCIDPDGFSSVGDEYARIDRPGTPGCFTDIADKP